MVLALLLIASDTAIAAPVSLYGTFDDDDELFTYLFTVPFGLGEVSGRSFSFGGGINGNAVTIAEGGFIPVLSVFLATGPQTLLQVAEGGTNTCLTPGHGNEDSVSHFCWDAFFDTELVAGDYKLVITQGGKHGNPPTGHGNPPIGPSFTDGFAQVYPNGDCFSYFPNPCSYTGLNYLADPSRSFILVDATQRTNEWAVDLEIKPIPEPSSVGLLALGLVGLIGFTNLRRGQVGNRRALRRRNRNLTVQRDGQTLS